MKFYTTFRDYPDDIYMSLSRADAYWYYDNVHMTFTIKSRNVDEPLTDDEKHRITTYLGLVGFKYEVLFV